VNILEDFKKKAAKLRQDQEQSSAGGSDMRLVRNMRVVDNMQIIHAYLHDLIEQLNFVDPDIRCSMSLDSFGELIDLRQGDYGVRDKGNRGQQAATGQAQKPGAAGQLRIPSAAKDQHSGLCAGAPGIHLQL